MKKVLFAIITGAVFFCCGCGAYDWVMGNDAGNDVTVDCPDCRVPNPMSLDIGASQGVECSGGHLVAKWTSPSTVTLQCVAKTVAKKAPAKAVEPTPPPAPIKKAPEKQFTRDEANTVTFHSHITE